WLGFPFDAVDFGVGKPCIFMPLFETWEGVIYDVPSFEGDGSIDVYITLFQQHLDKFRPVVMLFKELLCCICSLHHCCYFKAVICIWCLNFVASRFLNYLRDGTYLPIC
ncbi:hypothetical protein MKW98_030143, partial [Papaver atlanticum]